MQKKQRSRKRYEIHNYWKLFYSKKTGIWEWKKERLFQVEIHQYEMKYIWYSKVEEKNWTQKLVERILIWKKELKRKNRGQKRAIFQRALSGFSVLQKERAKDGQYTWYALTVYRGWEVKRTLRNKAITSTLQGEKHKYSHRQTKRN